jgi:hypothetical protein
VQILIVLEQVVDGRLSGTAALVGAREALPFSGTLELVTRLEELSRSAPTTPEQGDQ